MHWEKTKLSTAPEDGSSFHADSQVPPPSLSSLIKVEGGEVLWPRGALEGPFWRQ